MYLGIALTAQIPRRHRLPARLAHTDTVLRTRSCPGHVAESYALQVHRDSDHAYLHVGQFWPVYYTVYRQHIAQPIDISITLTGKEVEVTVRAHGVLRGAVMNATQGKRKINGNCTLAIRVMLSFSLVVRLNCRLANSSLYSLYLLVFWCWIASRSSYVLFQA